MHIIYYTHIQLISQSFGSSELQEIGYRPATLVNVYINLLYGEKYDLRDFDYDLIVDAGQAGRFVQ